MKATFPLIEVSALGELSDKVRRALVEPTQLALQYLRTLANGGIGLDNMRVATVTLLMTHNTELRLQSPFAPGMPLLWYPGRAIDTAGVARFVYGRLNPSRSDGFLGLSCFFDANVTCTVTGTLWAG
jgi:hypothetical protein